MPSDQEKREDRRVELPDGEWIGHHIKLVRGWLGISQQDMAKRLDLLSSSSIAYYEHEDRADAPLKGLVRVRLEEVAKDANATIVSVARRQEASVVTLSDRLEPRQSAESAMSKFSGLSTKGQGDTAAKGGISGILTREANDPHSEIQHLFIVNVEEGFIEHQSESLTNNPGLLKELSEKYAEDKNFTEFMRSDRNRLNLLGTVDSYSFALKFEGRDDFLLIGRAPIKGDAFHFMAVKKKLERVAAELAPHV